MKIWTQEEQDEREIENLLTRTTETCKECQWSNYEPGDEFTTCGAHLQNFATNSWCSYWTSKDNSKVKAYRDKRISELKRK